MHAVCDHHFEQLIAVVNAKMDVILKFTYLLLLLGGFRAQSVIWEEQNDAPAVAPEPRPKTLAEVQADYFNIEKQLWERIENTANDSNFGGEVTISGRRTETSVAIATIHKEVFFAETFEMASYWRAYLILGIEGLRDNLSIINATLDENYGYLYDTTGERVTFDAAKIDEWTRETMFRRLKNSIDGLFDITSHTDIVLRHIQRVRAMRFNCFLSFL